MYSKRRFGLELESRLCEDYRAAEVARWARALLASRDDLDPALLHEIGRAAAIADGFPADRGSHALRALARTLTGKGTEYRQGTLKDRALFEILQRLLEGPESFAALARGLFRGWEGEQDAADLAARAARLVALGWADAGLVSPGWYQALGRVDAARVLSRRDAYHFSLTRAGQAAWSDYYSRRREPTPPARTR